MVVANNIMSSNTNIETKPRFKSNKPFLLTLSSTTIFSLAHRLAEIVCICIDLLFDILITSTTEETTTIVATTN